MAMGAIGHLKGAAAGTTRKAMDFLTGKKEAAKKLSETRLATKVIKPPIEELDQFLEFQLPWQGPAYGDLLHAPRPKKNTSLLLSH
ncbi:hypothetical protein Tco_1306383 [Tanacetum coccineum]